ncbi:MAG: S1C family serine protease [Xanthobacteraceae bacterium]
MRNVGWLNLRPVSRLLKSLLAAVFAVALLSTPAPAETGSLEDLISAVVKIKTHINPEGRTVQGLGRDREGTGILIDSDGLILTIGYLMVEAYAAEIITNDGRTIPATIVGYDHETGFGLLRTIEPLKIKPFTFGKIADVKEKDVVVVASGGGASMVVPALVVSKREFVGNWEYLLDEAIYTSPPHPSWSGAALINREGKLIGVGSLIVGDAAGTKENNPGNVFVPIDRLAPILGDLLTEGRPAGPGRPWLGMNADDTHGRLMVGRVTPGGPADKAGVRRGDVIISVNGEATTSLPDFYRKVWSKGGAGAVIGLDVRNKDTVQHFDIQSINRLDHLKLKATF